MSTNLKGRWKSTSIANKLNNVLTGVICLATIVNVGNSFYQAAGQSRQATALTSAVGDVKTALANGSVETRKAIEAAIKNGDDLTRTTLKENREALAHTLDETLKQGKTALDVSIDNSKLDQRAWLGFVNTENLEFKADSIGKITF